MRKPVHGIEGIKINNVKKKEVIKKQYYSQPQLPGNAEAWLQINSVAE